MKNTSLLKELEIYKDDFFTEDRKITRKLSNNLKKNVFIYGSTPYDTAKKLITSISKKPKRFIVVGASIGWVNFYWNELYPNTPTIGIDLHTFRVEYGNKLIDKYNLKNIELLIEDLYNFEFKDGDMIWMSNLCFDADSVENMMTDIIHNHSDISMISYRPIRCKGYREKVKTYKLRVRWMGKRPLFVYEY